MPRPPALTEAEARKQAKKEAQFYASLAAYVVVNLGLVAVNLLTSPEYLWFVWPLLGWGLGLVAQGIGTFGGGRQGGWVARRTQELMGAEAGEARLRRLLDEELSERVLPAGAPQDLARLQRRIEHLEAIVTSPEYDLAVRAAPTPADPALGLDALAEPEPDAAPASRRTRTA